MICEDLGDTLTTAVVLDCNRLNGLLSGMITTSLWHAPQRLQHNIAALCGCTPQLRICVAGFVLMPKPLAWGEWCDAKRSRELLAVAFVQ